ncbi:la autoantigen-like [Colletes latitarsis]|uniref:la autoantigen-like n=1 Tax=Colletes latitarsis TaxID=2605962 RepID=UPI004035891E
MENGDEVKTENANSDATDEVKSEKPVSNVEENSTKETTPEEPSSQLLEKIKNQVEFYFGDVNMQRDKFLIEQTKLDKGWVPMSIMLKFKMLASLSKDADVILKALESSELIEISEDKKKIRRSLDHPLPVYSKTYRKAQEARTAYVKGFPLHDTTIDKLKTFFNDFEPYESIIFRKYHDKEKKLHFKGSIFIQFKTLEDAKAFMSRGTVMYENIELIKKWSNDYRMEKMKEKQTRRQKKYEMKAKKNETMKGKEDEESGEDDHEKDTPLPKGCVIHFSNASQKCSREDIKDHLGRLEASIAFVDFKIGDSEGWIRLEGENSAKSVVDKMKDGKLTICDNEVNFRVLEGEEEETYLAKAKEKMDISRQKFTKGKRANKKGRNGQRAQRKRRNSENNDALPNKKAHIDE